MSLPSQETIACKQCGHEQEFTIWHSINVTLNPELKEQLLTGQLTTFTCEACGTRAEVVWSLLYHDMEGELMVHVRLDDEPEETPDQDPVEDFMRTFTLRTVANRNELVEKVLLAAAGLDDRVIELFKVALWEQLEQDGKASEGELLFSAREAAEDGEEEIVFVLLTAEGQSTFAVPWGIFEYFAQQVAGRIPAPESEAGKWMRVDRQYAIGVI